MPQPEQNAPQPDQLLTLLRKDLTDLLSEKVDQEAEGEKTRQVMRLDKADKYYRGLQFLYPSIGENGSLGWSSVGTPTASDQGGESRGLYDYNIDIVKAYGRKYFGVLGLRPFHNLKAMPDDPQSEVDRKASRQADLAWQWLKAKWNARIRNIELFYHQWKAGTVYAYTPFIADKDLFGETREPQYVERAVEIEPGGYFCANCGTKSPQPEITPLMDDFGGVVENSVCPNCKAPLGDINYQEPQTATVPELQGYETYPGSGAALNLCTGYTVTVPFDNKDFHKTPYLLYEYSEHRGELLRMFGQVLRSQLTESGDLPEAEAGPVHQQSEQARQAAASITGTYRPNNQTRWIIARYWLSPSMYEYVDDAAKRQALQKNFPDGLKISRVSGLIVKLENEALSSVWAVFEPEPGDYTYKDPMCWGILGSQDVVNDVVNIRIAREERGLPTSIADAELIDVDAINSRQYLPMEVIPSKAGHGGSLREAIVNLPTPNKDDGEAQSLIGLIDGNVQQHTGLLPPVWGGGEKAQTAEETKTRLNQALMQLSVPGEYASIGWITTATNAVKLIAKHAPKGFVVPIPDKQNGATSEMLDLDALRAGKFHFEGEPGIPMSWGEKQAQLNLIIGQNPELAAAMGLNAPMNVPALRDYVLPNMNDLRVPGEDVRDKVIETIQQLLEQQPIEQMGPNGPERMPSIQPEEFVDDPVVQAEIVREWCLSAQGRKARVDNPAGYSNVVAYGLLLSRMAAPPMIPGPNGEPIPAGPDGGPQQAPPGLPQPGAQPEPQPAPMAQ